MAACPTARTEREVRVDVLGSGLAPARLMDLHPTPVRAELVEALPFYFPEEKKGLRQAQPERKRGPKAD
jgi:hypothetical protein